MSIKKLAISGLRGFATEQPLTLAIPNGANGSGLTVLVGPNNGGKSTIVEAFRAVSVPQPTSFGIGRRNQKAGSRIDITVTNDLDATFRLRTVDGGGSETIWEKQGDAPVSFVVPSRRFFSPVFGAQGAQNRQAYIVNYGLPPQRGTAIDQFASRLFEIQKNRAAFEELLREILDPLPNWTIDQSDAGYFLRFEIPGAYHSSEGLGEGLVSLFFIVDALYDAPPGAAVVIDEPELSLHPALLRKLGAAFSKWSANRQLIIATHSPYFVDFADVFAGARIARVYQADDETKISALSEASIARLRGFLENLANPHVLGIDAREVFFLLDGVMLVEGQEDVILYRKLARDLGKPLSGEFYGWGVGGAGNMSSIASVLRDLGFKRVAGVLDGNKKDAVAKLEKDFPDYDFFVIPSDDIRTKSARAAVPEVVGLFDLEYNLKAEFKEAAAKLIDSLNSSVG